MAAIGSRVTVELFNNFNDVKKIMKNEIKKWSSDNTFLNIIIRG